jgi:hypothetical protein
LPIVPWVPEGWDKTKELLNEGKQLFGFPSDVPADIAEGLQPMFLFITKVVEGLQKESAK